MKKHHNLVFKLALLFIPFPATSQNMPVSLHPEVNVQFVMNISEKCARLAKDPISGNFFYITSIGNVYEIKDINNSPHDTLLYTAATHEIDFLQGMTFIDSALFLIGNKLIDSTGNIGFIKKAVLQPSGIRTWINVAVTDTYPQSFTWYDHGMSGIVVSPDKNYLFFSSGSRTDHGEEQNNYGQYPGMREVPLTSGIFRIPANSENLLLHNNEDSLSPYLFADGTRNSFDMAFDADGNLFATENSGDRDDPDELNWVRQGKHYGFPWIMGGNNNPQQFPGYSADNDALLNKKCNAYLKGYYYNDPDFPSPSGLTFTSSLSNLGPDADKFRENSGQVNDGSSSGNFLHSFTPHRSPLGLVFDRKNILVPAFKGDAFLVCFTRGGDSTGLDIYGNPGTIADPGQDLLHINFIPDSAGNYQMQVNTIVNNFDYPVDTYLDGNILYVIEYSVSGDGRLFKVTLPLDPVATSEKNIELTVSVFPNPTSGIFTIQSSEKISSISITNLLGEKIFEQHTPLSIGEELGVRLNQPKGIYFLEIISEGKREMKKIVVN